MILARDGGSCQVDLLAMLKIAKEKAGIKGNLRIHDLRHTLAFRLRRDKGVPLRQLWESSGMPTSVRPSFMPRIALRKEGWRWGSWTRACPLDGTSVACESVPCMELRKLIRQQAALLEAYDMPATPEQLRERWLSEDGQRRLADIIAVIRKKDKFNFQVDLSGADLSGLDLTNADLPGANLAGATLRGAILKGACLVEGNFEGADLKNIDLTRAYLPRVIFNGADLSGANLSNANFEEASFAGVNLTDGNLPKANFAHVNLAGINLTRANLSEANFIGADLRGANLSCAILKGSNLTSSQLERANLRGADLSKCMLIGASLKGANISGSMIYGVSAWGVELNDQTIQESLVITPPEEPVVTVDSLEVAQFIYLLINNEKIRNVIDTITSKVVLILGRFTSDRKAILDAIRDDLRKRGHIPILFDFDKPASRNTTETVRTLAHMARFVIADITDAKCIPQELQAIVPDIPSVAVQPLIKKGCPEYGMFGDFRAYPWVMPIHEYSDQAELIANLERTVVAPAEAKAKELQAPPPSRA